MNLIAYCGHIKYVVYAQFKMAFSSYLVRQILIGFLASIALLGSVSVLPLPLRADPKSISSEDPEQLLKLGGKLLDGQNYSQALENLNNALVIFKDIGNCVGERRTFNLIGVTYAKMGEPDTAIGFYQSALGNCQENRDRSFEATVLVNIGRSYFRKKVYRPAFDSYHKALTILETTGDREKISESLSYIGDIYSDLGRNSEAEIYYKKAIKARKSSRDTDNTRNSRTNVSQ